MSRFSLPSDSESQTSDSSQTETVNGLESPRDGAKDFLNWSLESRGSDNTVDPWHKSNWRWFSPAQWASQWTEKSPAHLALHPPSVWVSACPLCSGQGPEWARVVQEPPPIIHIQPTDFSSKKKSLPPFLPKLSLIDWDDSWGHRQSYSRYRASRGILFRKSPFPQDQELLAASVGHLDWLHQSLKNQKDFRSDRRGFTALHLAAERGNLECMIALVDHYKFPLDMTTTKGWTPLHLAINKDNPVISLQCIEYLLKKGAPINARNRNGMTPLHLASGEGMLDCIKVLVKAGADVHALDNQNRKCIDICKTWNHRECARFLKDAMWKRDKKDLAEEMGQLNQLKKRLLLMQNKYLLEKKKEKEVQNRNAFTKWLQTKPLPRLPKVKILEPAPITQDSSRVTKKSGPVTKESAQITKESATITKESAPVMKEIARVTKKSAPITKESAPVTKESARVTKKSAPVTKEAVPVTKEPASVTKESAGVTKEAPHVKKSPQVTKPKPPLRPRPPSKRRPVLTPPARRRFRSLERAKLSRPRTPLAILPSLSPLIPSHQSPSSPQSRRSNSLVAHRPPLLSTVRSLASSLPQSPLAESSSSRPSANLYLSPSFPQGSSSRANLRPSYPFLHPPPELTPCELKPRDAQKLKSSVSAPTSPKQPLLSLLDSYLMGIPPSPPPARPSSPSSWTVKWNLSTKPDARPVTQIAFPQGVRLGVHPDPVRKPDFCDFLHFSPDGEGGVHIQTADGQWIFPVPRLPFKVLLQELCPSRQRPRLKVPEGLRRLAIQDLPRRRYPGDQCFWTDSMAMSLRNTFDPDFISLVRRHQGLPPLSPTSPTSPSSSSCSSLHSSTALRQCRTLLFYSPNDPPLIK
ncbi:ankyrin repeat domain-containing protein 53 [Notamacropus eugenii]|uniref:ankyrin repeat domain-containing protein 53 n=1 Tax=Notamacropus eugenii TaxID=9315 RepID=UPI003B67BAE8